MSAAGLRNHSFPILFSIVSGGYSIVSKSSIYYQQVIRINQSSPKLGMVFSFVSPLLMQEREADFRATVRQPRPVFSCQLFFLSTVLQDDLGEEVIYKLRLLR